MHSPRTDLVGLKANAEEFLAAMLDSVAQPIWAVDAAGLIRFVNPAATRALGYDDAQGVLGRSSHQTFHYRHLDGSPYPAEECPMRLPSLTGELVTRELDWFVRRDGSMFPVSAETSTNRTVAPRYSAALVVPANVSGEVTISSPGPRPAPWYIACSAAVPELSATAWAAEAART